MKRYLSIWFPYLIPDRLVKQKPELQKKAFVTVLSERGRQVIQSSNIQATVKGIKPGMILADARAIFPDLPAIDHQPALPAKLLNALGEWCLRFTPIVMVDLPDGLMLDISGCPHLWGGELHYSNDITARLNRAGYHVNTAIADTMGAAWAVSRYGKHESIIPAYQQKQALLALPAEALRIDILTASRLYKLGLNSIGSFVDMPSATLRRRFGKDLVQRIELALGLALETLNPISPALIFQERLSCLDPVRTAKAIKIALQQLLEKLCKHLLQEGKGLRKAVLKCYRVDDEIQSIEIGTNKATRNISHIFRLMEQKITNIDPGLGIELFVLEAPVTEPLKVEQEYLWTDISNEHSESLIQLIDRISVRIGNQAIKKYLPAEHHWPERSYVPAKSITEQPIISWPQGLRRPVYVLPKPEPIQVSVPIPDYPPMLFVYKGKVHNIKKADGPERIEREWFIEKGLQRDYYIVEDQTGARYWLFRSGHYDTHIPEWFIHGFFA